MVQCTGPNLCDVEKTTNNTVKTDIWKRNDYAVLSKCKMALYHQCIVFNSLVKDNMCYLENEKQVRTRQTRLGFRVVFER